MKKALKCIGIILLVIVLAVVLFFGVLTVTEYKPKHKESVAISGNATGTLYQGDSLQIMTWNVGYGSLGESADFFMDGGDMVMTASKEGVMSNMDAIIQRVGDLNPDVVFFQEVDTLSKRAHRVNEENVLKDAFPAMDETFAYNYKTLYVPYPWPTIGRVEAGLVTLSDYDVTSAERQQLPVPFKYPVRLANLKRCLLINRVPIQDSDKELVLVNLHLEAYDSGEGKAAQTAMLKEILETEAKAGNYVIAGGDFNQSFSNVDNSMYPAINDEVWMPGQIDVNEFGEGLTFVQDNTTPSCRSLDKPYTGSDKENFQYYLIDGFIVSSNLNIDKIETIDTGFVNTDHNPVIMEVTLD